MNWKFMNTGFHSGSFNMKYDLVLAQRISGYQHMGIVRFYGWQPYAISIGYNQNINDFDVTKVFNSQIDIVRRPTGGRAILHADELTYSVVIKMENGGPRFLYCYINEALLCGLRYLGINAYLTDKDADLRKFYQTQTSIPCFASSTRNEIQYKGRKLVGSAQRRYGNVILQHGSLLLGPYHQRIVDFLADHVQNSRSILEYNLANQTTDAETILNRKVTFDEAVSAIKRGFEDHFEAHFEDSIVFENIYAE